MRSRNLLGAGLAAALCRASETVFSVHDDIFAFPQYGVEFAKSYVLEADAHALLRPSSADGFAGKASSSSSDPTSHTGDISAFSHQGTTGGYEGADDAGSPGTYERLLLHGRPHLCHIPAVDPVDQNNATANPSQGDREKELDRAVARGAELLQGMTSNQCLYYSFGWWTYSFCYNAQVTQFHALPLGANGRPWPPQEDPESASYVLGKFQPAKETSNEQGKSGKEGPQSEGQRAVSTEVQTKAETNFLVQRLEGGTPCDLTGNDRKIEVQFHCNPQMTDRIGWIKETATCAYLMVIYTPRLCNDVAFQPAKESRAHPITCREIVAEDEVSAWESRHAQKAERPSLDQGQQQQIVLGRVKVGGLEHVGRDGKRLERGRIVLTRDERAETVVMQKDGQVTSLSKSELKRLKISPEEIDAFKKELQRLAGSKDWKIERLDDVHGQTQLRGVVSNDGEDDKAKGKGEERGGNKREEAAAEAPKEQDDDAKEDDVVGSEEEYVEEL